MSVGMIFGPIVLCNRIDQNVIMQMGLIQVGANNHFIAIFKQTFTKPQANTVRLFRRYLPRGKGLDDVICLHAICFAKALFGRRHFCKGRPDGTAVDSAGKKRLFCFFRVGDVCDIGCKMCFFAVGYIGHAFVQPISDSKNFSDCHGYISLILNQDYPAASQSERVLPQQRIFENWPVELSD